jgi:hypothetical protein
MKRAMNRQEYEAITIPLLARVGVKPNPNVFQGTIKMPMWLMREYVTVSSIYNRLGELDDTKFYGSITHFTP